MAGKRAKPKLVPDAPDLPAQFDRAPARLDRPARWEGVHADADVQVAELVPDVEIRESVWVAADLAGRHLTGFQCRDTRFENCDLSGLVLDGASLTRVSFAGCRMTGIVLAGATLQDVRVDGSPAELANLRMTRARYLFIEDSSLRRVEFYQASIGDSALLDCDLTGADFTGCRVSNLDLHGSVLDDLHAALSLRGATISPDQAIALTPSLLADAGIRITATARSSDR
jgi:uncharacterized protein YjbI with pentapeptide repeats